MKRDFFGKPEAEKMLCLKYAHKYGQGLKTKNVPKLEFSITVLRVNFSNDQCISKALTDFLGFFFFKNHFFMSD